MNDFFFGKKSGAGRTKRTGPKIAAQGPRAGGLGVSGAGAPDFFFVFFFGVFWVGSSGTGLFFKICPPRGSNMPGVGPWVGGVRLVPEPHFQGQKSKDKKWAAIGGGGGGPKQKKILSPGGLRPAAFFKNPPAVFFFGGSQKTRILAKQSKNAKQKKLTCLRCLVGKKGHTRPSWSCAGLQKEKNAGGPPRPGKRAPQ